MSGKQNKRRRREAAAPPPPPVRKRGARQASPKVLLGVTAAAAALVGAVILGVALTRGSTTAAPVPAHGSLTGALPGAARVEGMFRGIPQDGNVLGSPEAPVTMVTYLDLQCPYCRTFEGDALPSLLSRYVRTGKVRIVHRPLAFIGPDSVRGRLMAIAAGDQGRQFNLVSLLYLNQGAENSGWLSDDLVTAAAASIPGIEVQRLLAAGESESAATEASAFDEIAEAERVVSTPTILVGRTGSRPTVVPLDSASDDASVAAAIERALLDASPPAS